MAWDMRDQHGIFCRSGKDEGCTCGLVERRAREKAFSDWLRASIPLAASDQKGTKP